MQGRELNFTGQPERREQVVGARPETQYATVDQLGGITGTASLDFGAFPGSNEAVVTFADVTVAAGSLVKAWFNGADTTVDHDASDHRYAPVFIQLTGAPDPGVGGIIYARSDHKMQGLWSVRYSWS